MCLFIESIAIRQGKAPLLPYHQDRVNRTQNEFFPGEKGVTLSELVLPIAPVNKQKIKCRILYGKAVEKIDFNIYRPQSPRRIRLVFNDDINYAFKFADRQFFSDLTTRIGPEEDFLIVKKGYLSDSKNGNILLHDGKGWVTPDTPLLDGVQRRFLLTNGVIREEAIHLERLKQFEKLKLINALNTIDEAPEYSIDQIIWP